MSLDDLTLFDATEYGEATPRKSRDRKVPALPVEALEDPWVYIRTTKGVRPYAHIIKALGPEGLGTYLTICNQLGHKLTNHGVTQMIRCPECEVGRQLS